MASTGTGAVTRVIAVEVDGMELLVETTLVQVVGREDVAIGDRSTQRLVQGFRRMLEAVERVALSTGQMLARTAQHAISPDVVQIEMGLKLSAKGDVIIAGCSAEAALKVTMTYDGGKRRLGESDASCGARASSDLGEGHEESAE